MSKRRKTYNIKTENVEKKKNEEEIESERERERESENENEKKNENRLDAEYENDDVNVNDDMSESENDDESESESESESEKKNDEFFPERKNEDVPVYQKKKKTLKKKEGHWNKNQNRKKGYKNKKGQSQEKHRDKEHMDRNMNMNTTHQKTSSVSVCDTHQNKEHTESGEKNEKSNSSISPRKHYLIEHAKEKSLLLNDISTIEENKLYVKHIDEQITKEDLHNYFKNAKGYIETRTSYTAKGKIKNFAYIQFDTKENAEHFLNNIETVNDLTKSNEEVKDVINGTDKANTKNDGSLHGFKQIVIKNKTLLVSISKPSRTVYEPNIVFVKFQGVIKEEDEVIKENMQQFCAQHFFEIKEIRIRGNENNKHGYIEMKRNEDVVKCVEEIQKGEVAGHCFILNYSVPLIKKKIIYDVQKIKIKREKEKTLKAEQKNEENNSTIFVSGLNFNTRKHKLQTLFGNIGEIDHINLSKKISKSNIKRNKGFAYITFKNVQDATSALILNGTILDGKHIMVSKYLEGGTHTDYQKKNLSVTAEEVGSESEKDEHDHGKINNHKKDFVNRKYQNYNFFKKKGAEGGGGGGKGTLSIHHKFDRNIPYAYEKKRINLSTDTKASTLATQNCINLENKKESSLPVGAMTNEDFRKMFIK